MGLKILKEAHNMRKNYSKEEKANIINLCSDGVSVTESTDWHEALYTPG